MYRSNSSKVFPVIILIVVVIALIAGLTTLGKYIFSGNSQQTDSDSAVETARDHLLKVGADRSVQMTIRGPIVANEKFRTYRVEVSPSKRTYTIYDGYLENPQETERHDNNTPAYEQFVHALDKAALTRPGRETTEQGKDLRGICATGNVYEFAINNGDKTENHYWTSDCKGSPGTFGANLQQVMNLFIRQLPNGMSDFSSPRSPLRF